MRERLIIQHAFVPRLTGRRATGDALPDGVAGRIIGRACVYGVADAYNTQFAPGCFDKTRAEKVDSGKVPLFLDHEHDSLAHVGVVRETPDVGNALMMYGDLFDNDSGTKALEYLKSVLAAKAFTGLSVGVYVRNAEWQPNPNAGAGAARATTREKKTKRVDGEDLTAADFIIVGDADDPSTWKLPWRFSSDEKTKSHLRNALARFNQIEGVSAEEKAKAKAKLKRLCKEHGIDVSDDFAAGDVDERWGPEWDTNAGSQEPSSIYTFTECELAEISITPMPAVPGAEVLHARRTPEQRVHEQLVVLRMLLTNIPRKELLPVALEFGLGELAHPDAGTTTATTGAPPSDAAIRAAATDLNAVPLETRIQWVCETMRHTHALLHTD